MAATNETLKQTIIVALTLCIACSVVVSASVVVLKPRQDANKAYEKSLNVVRAAGLYNEAQSRSEVKQLFSQFRLKIVDLQTGRYLTDKQLAELKINPATFDQKKAAKTPGLSIRLSPAEDIAGIKRRSNYAAVYVLERDGVVERMVLPVHGYGLWSTLYGFLAVKGNGNDVVGLTFYAHAETPGLGGEVDNPVWKALWADKRIYEADGDIGLTVVKGKAKPDSNYEIDGLAGATLTSRGVDNLIKYWLGGQGFGPYLANVQRGEV